MPRIATIPCSHVRCVFPTPAPEVTLFRQPGRAQPGYDIGAETVPETPIVAEFYGTRYAAERWAQEIRQLQGSQVHVLNDRGEYKNRVLLHTVAEPTRAPALDPSDSRVTTHATIRIRAIVYDDLETS